MAKSARQARIAAVTGGASGIGLATSEHLLDEGWKVAILDRDETALAAARKRFARRADVLVAELDVTDETAVQSAFAGIIKSLGGLDGLVNSAGIARDVPALETTTEQFRRILDVNVIGSFAAARAAAKLMIAAKRGGAIVNIASISGLRGSKGRVAYGASKGAVVTMTQVLATEWADHGIRVNAIAPGPVDTPMVKTMHTAADRALFLRHVPMNRYGDPAEIATAIAFLLDGTRAGYITGEILAVDGGFRGAGLIAGRT